MKQIFTALAIVTVASLSLAGCGDDDDSSGNTAGSSNAGAPSNPEGGSPSNTEGGAPASGNVMCDPTVNGVCQNDTDCPSVASGMARQAAGDCGLQCLGMEASCAIDCIVAATTMTNECASCYAGVVACATKNCLSQCGADPTSDDCKACQVEKGCRTAFDECSGLTE